MDLGNHLLSKLTMIDIFPRKNTPQNVQAEFPGIQGVILHKRLPQSDNESGTGNRKADLQARAHHP
jgi:hypothetical protein